MSDFFNDKNDDLSNDKPLDVFNLNSDNSQNSDFSQPTPSVDNQPTAEPIASFENNQPKKQEEPTSFRPWYENDEPFTPRKKRKRKNHKPVLFLALSCLLIFVSAFGGVYLGNTASGNGSNIVNFVTAEKIPATGSYIDVSKSVSPTVVEITTEQVSTSIFMSQYVTQGAGSGVIISGDGYIVTNNHVIEDANSIQVRTTDGTNYKAKLIGTDPATDIAVIKIEANNLPVAVFADSSAVVVGEEVIAVGNPLGSLGGTVTNGIISALDREVVIDNHSMTLMQTNTAVNPGNSGGGLFDMSGLLIGVVNAKSAGEDVEGIGFAIPANTAKKIATDLIENGYVTGKVQLGVTVIELNDQDSLDRYNLEDMGVYITAITDGSDAQMFGLQAGDYIVSINDETILKSAQIKAIIDNAKVGDKLSITVKRNGKKMNISVTLSEHR